VCSPLVSSARNTPRITPVATYVVDPPVTSNPTTWGDSQDAVAAQGAGRFALSSATVRS